MVGARVAALRRIAKLYGAVEKMHAVTFEQAAAAMAEVDVAIAGERGNISSANVAGREALSSGDRAEWMLSEVQREIAGMRQERLVDAREERVAARDAARDAYFESRVRTEQMKQVVKNLRMQEELEEERKVQGASDDRYLARLRWLAGVAGCGEAASKKR